MLETTLVIAKNFHFRAWRQTTQNSEFKIQNSKLGLRTGIVAVYNPNDKGNNFEF